MSEGFKDDTIDKGESQTPRQEAVKDICDQVMAAIDDRFDDAMSDSLFEGPESMQLFNSGLYFGRECDTLRMFIPEGVRFDNIAESIDTRTGFNRLTIRRPIDFEDVIQTELVELLAKPELIDDADFVAYVREMMKKHEEATGLELNDLNFEDMPEGFEVEYVGPDKMPEDDLIATYNFLTDQDLPDTNQISRFAIQEPPAALITLHRDKVENGEDTKVIIGVFHDGLKIMDIDDPWRVSRAHSGMDFMPFLVNYIDSGELIEFRDPNSKIGHEEENPAA